MPSMLSVNDTRRSRSKSPGGRERSRSRSAIRDDDRDYDRRSSGHHRSSRRYSESESDSGSESVDDRRRTRPSRKHREPDSEEDKRRRRASKYDESDDDRRRSSRKSAKHYSESESEDDRRTDRRKSKSTKNSSDQEDISIVIKRGQGKSKAEDQKVLSPRGSVSAVPSVSYGYPQQPGYPAQPPGSFPAERPGHYQDSRHMSYVGHDPRYVPPPGQPAADPAHRFRASSNAGSHYADVDQYRYAQVDARAVGYKYDDRPNTTTYDPRRSDSRMYDPRDRDEAKHDRRYSDDKYARREDGGDRRERKALEKKLEHEQKDRYREEGYEKAKKEIEKKMREDAKKKEEEAAKANSKKMSQFAAGGLGATLGASLGLGAASSANGHGGKPPASPLLEAYKGTYQSISPMPSALVLAAHKNDSDLSDLDLESDSDSSSSESDIDPRDPNADIKRKIRKLEKDKKAHEKARQRELKKEKLQKEKDRQRASKQAYETRTPDAELAGMLISPASLMSPKLSSGRKSVSFYDAERDAKTIEKALKGTRNPPDVKPLIHILPHLSIDDLDALKAEYKKHAKVEGQGINMSKHIKMRVQKHVGKAAYATSLGQWESEGFWANCFYQSGASRRELLIESLMGRTNQQIREIKNFFKDKRYDDDLEKCMKTELKADKFRTAILLALQEERMPESHQFDMRLIQEDVIELHEALKSSGGESAMIKIIVVRSDAHLREVMRLYETTFRENFARDMINKSRNLVGETLAHVLNGALNKPMRDAILIHQAISETEPGKERAELLISRLVRLHWDPRHLERVKQQYINRYNASIEGAIKREIQAKMKTEDGINWTNFCIELCRSNEP